MKKETKHELVQVRIFNHPSFGSVRITKTEKGEPLFVAKDVLRALGYRNISKALADHVAEDDVTKRYPIVDKLGRRQKCNVINESGLYALILGSKLQQATMFKHWVTSEVLPQIRMTGGYIPTRDARTGEPLTAEEIVNKAFGIMQRTISLENRSAGGCFSTTEVAKEYGMTAPEFYDFLTDKGIVKRVGGRYFLTERYAGRGFDAQRVHHSFSLDGRPKVKPYLVWTPAGKQMLDKTLKIR